MKTQIKTQSPPPPSPDVFSSPYETYEAEDAPILLNRYRIIFFKNDGGFGSVYVCWDTRLQRRVAIKIMPLATTGAYGANVHEADEWDEESLAARDALASTLGEALSEARASSNLNHPNIVTVHDFETDDAYAYLVMEYVDGLSLAEILTRVEGGVLLADEAAHVLQSLSSAVEYAHENGVLHLDIKPSNVLVAKDGRVYLTDFGMASLQSATGFADARGGTVGYMPPEQIEGETVDERADIFALGTVGYQAISGISPFAADTAEKSEKLIEKGAQPLGHVDVPLVGMVEDVFARAMAADAAQRPISAKEAFAPAVQYLGDPGAGQASLKNLLNQTADEEEAFDETPWRNLDAPGFKIPWLPSVLTRAANGFVTGFFVWSLLPFFGINDYAAQTLLSLAILAASCFYAPLGVSLGVLALTLALFSVGISATTILVAILLLAGVAGWILLCATKSKLAATDALFAPLLQVPAVAPALAAYSFKPFLAALTAAFSGLLAQVTSTLFASNPGTLLNPGATFAGASDLFAQNIVHFLTNPSFWASLGVFALSAFVGSFLGHFKNAGKFRLVASQIFVYCGVLCGLSLQAGLGSGLETGFDPSAIWGIPAFIPSVFGLVFCVVMSGVCVLFGLPRSNQNSLEGEDELS